MKKLQGIHLLILANNTKDAHAARLLCMKNLCGLCVLRGLSMFALEEAEDDGTDSDEAKIREQQQPTDKRQGARQTKDDRAPEVAPPQNDIGKEFGTKAIDHAGQAET